MEGKGGGEGYRDSEENVRVKVEIVAEHSCKR